MSSSPVPPTPALRPSAAGREHLALIEALHADWLADPASVPESWQAFFAGFDLGLGQSRPVTAAPDQARVDALVHAYRSQGHRAARVNPLEAEAPGVPELAPERFGLAGSHHDQVFAVDLRGHPGTGRLADLLAVLQEIYGGTTGYEIMHVQDLAARDWLLGEIEPDRSRTPPDRETQLRLLEHLTDAQLFETFVHTHFPGQKRFSLEGAEAVIPAICSLVETAAELGVEEIVLGMSHRGRLNVLANVMEKSYATIFSEFEDNYQPEAVYGWGDVKYHKGFHADRVTRSGRPVHLSLTANPSHLELVGAVVQGRTRAKQRQRDDLAERRRVLPLVLHGDAAFAGQGIVAELLNMSQLEGYRVGGTVHLIVNNQIGFTTTGREARSSTYCTDVAKMIEAPILHVNGDEPEAVARALALATRYRQRFGRDVVVDLVCYRRHGHNEGDDPGFTQPAMYRTIARHPPVRERYARALVAAGRLDPAADAATQATFRARLQAAFDQVRTGPPDATLYSYGGLWKDRRLPYGFEPVDTAVAPEQVRVVGEGLARVPAEFALHPKLERRLRGLREALATGGEVDWGFAELLAFGTLLGEGTPIRLSGQDSARGTFSHRHAVWFDQQTQAPHVAANHLAAGQAKLCVYNSLLSEAAVLAFDYGYSLAEPRLLILWEAQFGDFANGAQAVIDQFITSAESKWGRSSGLVMLLPHGSEGQGPEHSNAYVERYLAACADDNVQVVNATTPAQYFHLLRRQVRRTFRKPLIVFTPKSLLRHRSAVSPLADLSSGTFAEVLDDPTPPAQARRVLLCAGKVYYELAERRASLGDPETAIVRLEQLYPLHAARLTEVLARYPAATDVRWVQEETRNRGAWTFLAPRLRDLLPAGATLRYVGRPDAASPAPGSLRVHRAQQEALLAAAFADRGVAT
jgi:2-oxoglutarate dehydrogenase E1 component